jgi:hypothetical protein
MIRRLLCLSFALALPAAAQSVSIFPGVVQLRGTPGATSTQTLTLANRSSLPLDFVLEAQDVVVRGGRRSFVAAGEVPGGIARTAVFSAKSVTVPAGEQRSVDVTVTVPPAMSQRAMVALFRGTTRVRSGNSAATVSLGTLLTFTLGEQVSLSPSELRVAPQSASANAAFDLDLANDGQEPLVAKGVAVILDSAGAFSGRVSFDTRRLLPGERFTFHAEYPGDLRRGRYRVVSTFEYEGRSLVRSAPLVIR